MEDLLRVPEASQHQWALPQGQTPVSQPPTAAKQQAKGAVLLLECPDITSRPHLTEKPTEDQPFYTSVTNPRIRVDITAGTYNATHQHVEGLARQRMPHTSTLRVWLDKWQGRQIIPSSWQVCQRPGRPERPYSAAP